MWARFHLCWIYKAKICGTALMASFFCFGESLAANESYVENTSVIALKAKYNEISIQLQNNQFNRPMWMSSEESSHDLKGEIYAVIDESFSNFNNTFRNQTRWCDALVLNLNVKYCHITTNKDGNTLTLNLGKKYPQALVDTYRLEFKSQDVVTTPHYFLADYDSKTGPLGTFGYRILIEAIPLKDEQTFLHFTYAYSFGLAARLAMQTYIATLGRNKVGFTVIGKQRDGHAIYIQGIRGIVERNTMRFYLAIDAYLVALTQPVEKQLQKSLDNWYSSSEQYAKQLHEVELNEYLEMKHHEYQRQQIEQ
jgi:hypothetical protein